MPIRPILDLRTDLIDSISAAGLPIERATRIADAVISPTGQVQDPTLTHESLMDVIARMSSVDLSSMLPAGVVPVTPSSHKNQGKPSMWKDGPPQPGWLVPRLILARRKTDLLYWVSELSDRVRLTRMPGPPPDKFITEYRNLHRDWRATEFILCDDCRYNEFSSTICDDCARRRLRRTGLDRWDLPKFCEVAFEDQDPLPPTRFNREPVI